MYQARGSGEEASISIKAVERIFALVLLCYCEVMSGLKPFTLPVKLRSHRRPSLASMRPGITEHIGWKVAALTGLNGAAGRWSGHRSAAAPL
jgi:hypothetical protein